ncbi:dirigent protein 1-like [Panicum miliaceum]|uniref:Dirigent protein n=1 Tax=Panicum miliaceum TaxID=4540 RepID=A0A3L6TEB6_PANMI|nr:dirigent protein 1-like [Panicum miliaceum]
MMPKRSTRSGGGRLTCAAAALMMAIILVLQLQLMHMAAAATSSSSSKHHLHFFMHDGYTGPRPTAALIVNGTGAPVMPGVRFGDTVVMDDVLTEGPARASRPVGRAQGTYVTASLEKGQPAMLLSMNVVLTDYDGYSGSTVAVMGRNDITAPVRELAVVGGTGRFRMATGYVLWKTASWKGKNAVLEIDIYLRVV